MIEREAITPEGLEALRPSSSQLEGEGRRTMAARIQAARELGDLKENAEYHIAKEDQAHLETKIKRLTERLRAARVVEGRPPTPTWSFGATVTSSTRAPAARQTCTLVGPTEADLKAGKLSAESPVARALIGVASATR